MKLKVTGSFTRLIGAATKHQLIENSKGSLVTTELFKDIRHAYSGKEKTEKLRQSFLSVPIYEKLYQKFRGKDLPLEMIDKILIREFDIEDHLAIRVANNFIEGANACQLLIDNHLIDISKEEISNNDSKQTASPPSEAKESNYTTMIPPINTQIHRSKASTSKYVIHIVGEGINTELSLEDADDFAILNAVISKLKKKITKKNENEQL